MRGPKTVRKIYIKTRNKQQKSSSERNEDKWATMPLTNMIETAEISMPQEAKLEITIPGEPDLTRMPLDENDQVIGRAEECDVEIVLNNVSRRHACIYRYRKEYVIEDLNSRNGTFVNDERIDHCVLRNKDRISIGDATILFTQT